MSLPRRIKRYLDKAEWHEYSEDSVTQALSRAGFQDGAEFHRLYHLWLTDTLPPRQAANFENLVAPIWHMIFGESLGLEERLLQYLVTEIEAWYASHPDDGPPLVVDAGCGIGLHTAFLAHEFPQALFIAYDQSLAFVQITEQRLGGQPNVQVFHESHEGYTERGIPSDILVTCRSSLLGAPCCQADRQRERHLSESPVELADYLASQFGHVKAGGSHIFCQYMNNYALAYFDEILGHIGLVRRSHTYLHPDGEDRPCHVGDPIRSGAFTYVNQVSPIFPTKPA